MMPKCILSIVAVLVFLSPTFGQQPASTPQSPADSKAQQELNAKAQAFLAEIAQQARGLKNKENQSRALAGVADLLWKDHAPAARALYQEALDNLRQALDDFDQNDPDTYDRYGALSDLRDRLLESLGRHDPKLARDLFRKSRLSPRAIEEKPDAAATEVPAAIDDRSADRRLELSFALAMADQDPKEAVRIAREALNEGYSSELTSLLPKLREKEPTVARELAGELVNKLRQAELDSNYEAVGLALFLVGEAISSESAATEEGQTEKRAALLDPQTSREFIEFITNAALKKQSGRAAGALLMNLQSMMDGLERVAPAQAARLKQKFSEMEKENAMASPYGRFQQLSQENDTKAMLELARIAPREMRDSMYSQAAYQAWQQGDKERATEIATTKISSLVERNRLLTSFREQTITELLGKEDFAQARKLIAQIRSSDQRVRQLIDLAAVLAEKKDKKAAVETLQEAQSLLPGKAKNESELEAQLRLAAAFSRLDPDRSFALISSVIDQVNELITATALVANFGFSPVTIKDDEFGIDSYIPFGFRTLSPEDIRTLAQADFEKTRAVFDRFQRPEIRLAGYLFMSQSILEPESNDCTCPQQLKKLKGGSPNKE